MQHHSTKVDEYKFLSTPEFYGTHISGRVGRVGDVPDIEDESGDHHDVEHLGDGVPTAEGSGGGGAFGGLDCLGVLGEVQVFQTRIQPVAAKECQREQAGGQDQHDPAGWPAPIEPLSQHMQQGHDPTGCGEMEIARRHQLDQRSRVVRVIGRREQLPDFIRSQRRADNEAEKDRGAQPDGCVHDPDESQETRHVPNVGKAQDTAKPRFAACGFAVAANSRRANVGSRRDPREQRVEDGGKCKRRENRLRADLGASRIASMDFRSKIIPRGQLSAWREAIRQSGRQLVVTNGCFDLLHAGHVAYLEKARNAGDALLVGVTGDASVRELKGAGRPINSEADRAVVLAALESVDAVCIFHEQDARGFLTDARPDIYAKGGDYTLDTIDQNERRLLEGMGSKVVIVPGVPGRSTTKLLEQITKLLVFLALMLPGMVRAGTAPGIKWQLEVHASDSSPAVANDGTIYFGTFFQQLWAVSSNGLVQWKFETGSEIKSSPALGEDGTIYFGCRDRKFYAVTSEGREKWEFTTGGWVDSSPALARDGTVYFGSWDKRFYAVNPDGSLKWEFPTGGEIDSSPAIGADGAIYFGSHDRKFYALEPDGRKRWEYATGGPIISSPAIASDGTVYFTSVDGWFYAVNADGSLRWRLKTGGATASSPVIDAADNIYVGVNDHLWSIGKKGKKRWALKMEALVEATPAVVEGDAVYVRADHGLLRCLSPQGRIEWEFYRNFYCSASPAVGRDGTIYEPGPYDTMVALQGTLPLAQSAWPRFRGNLRNSGEAQAGLR